MLLEKYIGRERVSGFAFGRVLLQAGTVPLSLAKTLAEPAASGTTLVKRVCPGGRLPAVAAGRLLSLWRVGKGFQSWAGGLGWPRWMAEVRLGCRACAAVSDARGGGQAVRFVEKHVRAG